jgi:hypothetical protein
MICTTQRLAVGTVSNAAAGVCGASSVSNRKLAVKPKVLPLPGSFPPRCARPGTSLLHQHLIQQLPDRTMRFQNGVAVVHSAFEIGIGEGDAPERHVAENIAGRGPLEALREE